MIVVVDVYYPLVLRAAFQYGVKMSEGRKTRRYGGGAGGKAKEKAKLDREWQQISAVSYPLLAKNKWNTLCYLLDP